ncbi:MAG: alpha/beta hydrolase [Rhodospirillaceae bacterium]|nr:alpha/beta hydrolase [Rhodospirillaceae bacterium]MBT7647465.1 alpha/beta hydrolase [Rhodospirillaceae bacterium]
MGPRPLPLHLATSASVLMSSLAALGPARSGLIAWNESRSPKGRESADRIQTAIAAADAEDLARAVANEATERLSRFVTGIRAYRDHPYQRPDSEVAVLWHDGSSRLLDYGGDGRPVLLVPSLINRAHILDLRCGASFCAWLRANGLRPLLLDWGAPGDNEIDFDLDAYITDRLGPALKTATTLAGAPVPMLGYCMGGLLTLAAALLSPDHVAGLALLATPWDFHAERSGQTGMLAVAAALPTTPSTPPLPVDLIQALFASLQPNLIQAKFRRFAAMDPESPDALAFVALEDWLNDGVELAAPAARNCLIGWYRDNQPGKGCWKIGGKLVDPARLTCPSFVALPTRDRIVPPSSASALANALPNPVMIEPRAGHIGMMVGSRAEAALWEPLGAWLRDV